MKIALLGYGKMGKAIEKTAVDRGHEIVLKINKSSGDYNIKLADVAIDFSTPDTAKNHISKCLKNAVPVISGTTGWLQKYDDIVQLCTTQKGAFIYASNFSLGVNLFFELNAQLAKLMQAQPQYNTSIEEIHHTQKLDAPSGTAITLAEDIIAQSPHKNWHLTTRNNTTPEDSIPITSKRIDNIPGTHNIIYNSIIDTIQISHTAHNRQGFALGAVVAAEWIIGKTGIFTMKDVLNMS
ncbi:MAG: 4-hydroxy-tetrahydrodipicolinate reductase [Flavobacteriaceae bacterium]|nr:4-hydroxy-tetrahydrodipicolinate reductase [Flavobacteriaceae bacterium]